MINNYLTALVSSLIFSLFFTPKIKEFGLRYKIKDSIDNRKINKISKVRIGGIAILISIFFGVLICYLYSLINPNENYHSELIILIILATSITIIGLFDDIKSVSPLKRLFGQLFISSIAWATLSKFEILNFDIFNFIIPDIYLNQIFSFVFSVLWITGITNAINWIDGLDGLAASWTLITNLFILISCLITNNFSLGIISASIIGSNLGFLKYNLYPSKIIMGDSGSYFLGFTIAINSLIITKDSSGINSVVSLILLVFLPLIDMLCVIIQRILKGSSPFLPDRSHLHYKLLNNGFSIRGVLCLYSTLTIIFCSISFLI